MPTQPKIKLNQQFNPGNARWCDEHNRLECVKMSRRTQTDCHAPALRGTSNCAVHSGGRKKAMAKGEARITAWSMLGTAAAPISASTAVLAMLNQSWLRAAAYGELLRRQVAADGELTGAIEDDLSGEQDGGAPNTGGLVGYRYGMGGKDGILYRQGEAARELVILEAQERDRVVKYAKTAHDMGISDKMVQLAERWGDVVVNRIMLIIEGLQLTPEQQLLVAGLVTRHLGTIELEAGDGGDKRS